MPKRKSDSDAIEEIRKKWRTDDTWTSGFLHDFRPEVSPRHEASQRLCKANNRITVKTILECCRLTAILSEIVSNNLSVDQLINVTYRELEKWKMFTPGKRRDLISSLSECVSILDSNGLDHPTFLLKLPRECSLFQEISLYMKETIYHHRKNHSGRFTDYNILMIQLIRNHGAWEKYKYRRTIIKAENDGKGNEHVFFHASPSFNEIMMMGFDEKFCSSSAMFGCGIYFADVSSKSNLYVHGEGGGRGCDKHHNKKCHECPRHMLLCQVALGASDVRTDSDRTLSHPPPFHHAVVGAPSPGGLHHPEFVLYRGEQAYPLALVTYKLSNKD